MPQEFQTHLILGPQALEGMGTVSFLQTSFPKGVFLCAFYLCNFCLAKISRGYKDRAQILYPQSFGVLFGYTNAD